jgi:cytochrome b
MREAHQDIRVWDPFVRFFHWSLLLAYLVAWISAEEWASLHEQSGYYIMVLIGLRLVWGLVGSRYALFSDFLAGPRATIAYLRALAGRRAARYLGHNPAGGWMIMALLFSLLGVAISGLLIGADGVWEELHEGLAALSLTMVVVHVIAVLLASALHEENLIGAMLSGTKPRRGSDV